MTAGTTLIRDADWVVRWDQAEKRHAYGRGLDILLRDGRIVEMAPHRPDAPPPPGATVMEGRGFLVMPGLVNVHTHPTTEPGFRGVREDHGVPEQQMTGLYERL